MSNAELGVFAAVPLRYQVPDGTIYHVVPTVEQIQIHDDLVFLSPICLPQQKSKLDPDMWGQELLDSLFIEYRLTFDRSEYRRISREGGYTTNRENRKPEYVGLLENAGLMPVPPLPKNKNGLEPFYEEVIISLRCDSDGLKRQLNLKVAAVPDLHCFHASMTPLDAYTVSADYRRRHVQFMRTMDVVMQSGAGSEGISSVGQLFSSVTEITSKNLKIIMEKRAITERTEKATEVHQANAAKRHEPLLDAARERRGKKPDHTINAVALHLIDGGKSTLKKRQTIEVIKHLWE